MKDENTIADLYQDSNKGKSKDQPPEALDHIIMSAAQKSIDDAITPPKKSNRTMWMAAASVALVSPLLVWMAINVSPTQMEKAEDYFPAAETQIMAPEAVPVAKPKAKKDAQPMSAEVLGHVLDNEQGRKEQDKITVTGSRIDSTDDFAAEEGMVETELTEPEVEYDEAAPSPAISLQRNQALLKSELKAKKQRINQDSIADPMMALEWQRLQQYIEQGNKAKAQALITTMQVDWPDYDFTTLSEQVEGLDP